ncbi:MAG: hypothetical protein CMG23_00345 [Candidatus Marinimicrobia bacterium]|nr:hypothetical protein [Candidatus Neomarinimicrobiota bacterium]
MNKIILFLALFGIVNAELIRPAHGQELNYIHVVFEWEQLPDAISYQLELHDLSSNSFFTFDSLSTTVLLLESNIIWENSYQWKVRAWLGEDNYSEWMGPATFHTKHSRLGYRYITNHEDSLIQPGLTIFGGASPNRHSFVIDKHGNEIWNDDGYKFKINHVDEYGSLYGNSDHSFPENTACKINYDMNILWASNIRVDPHDMKETSRNTYFVMKNTYSNGPIPSDNSLTDIFQGLGFAADDTTNEFPWYGQRILELSEEGDILWEWNPFDHFQMDDFDNHGHTWLDGYIYMEYDWTHSNALWFDENESAIYLSSRHLSRVTKIDYPSGEILLNITLPSPYISNGDSYIGNNLLFNFQHHIVKLDNGNYTLFDNGNISNQLFEHEQRISRGIEFEILEDSTCNIVWEYSLPPALYGHACGSMQVLENNNRLIFTRGVGANPDRPTILEVTHDKQIVWEMRGTQSYGWYRALRIPSLHPDAFSVMLSPYSKIDVNEIEMSGVIIDSTGIIKISIKNESEYSQPYEYTIKDKRKWIRAVHGIDTIDALGSLEVQLNYNNSQMIRKTPYSELQISVTPVKHPYAKKYQELMIFDQLNNSSIDNTRGPIVSNIDNVPNPFNPNTTLKYELLVGGPINITIYDLMGREVKTLFDGYQEAGARAILWDSTDDNGILLGTGFYFYTIRTSSELKKGKMLFLK